MKEQINKPAKKTPLIFKCDCGNKFISNEYKLGLMAPSSGYYPDAKDICPDCKKEVNKGRIYCPLHGSEEYKKWKE